MSKKKNRELEEGKNFITILYTDSESYDCELLLNRLSSFWDRYYYILHDRDYYTETDYDRYITQNKEEPTWSIREIKKAHYHLIGSMDSNRTLEGASRKFGVPYNMVQRAGNFKLSVQYLIHLNNPEKAQYNLSELITNDEKINDIMSKTTSSTEKAQLLIDFIYDSKCNNLTSLAQFAIKNNCWDELRRGQHIYTSILFERNNVK